MYRSAMRSWGKSLCKDRLLNRQAILEYPVELHEDVHDSIDVARPKPLEEGGDIGHEIDLGSEPHSIGPVGTGPRTIARTRVLYTPPVLEVQGLETTRERRNNYST